MERHFRGPRPQWMAFLSCLLAIGLCVGCEANSPNTTTDPGTTEPTDPDPSTPGPSDPEAGEPTRLEPQPSVPGEPNPASPGSDSPSDPDDQPGQGDPDNDPGDDPKEPPTASVEPDEQLDHPFVRRVKTPDFPKDITWLNTSGPLRRQDLKGKFVLLDFWTYCCINCLHILPELKKLEKAYPNELVVIGVHSAKFEAEKVTKNIEEAILRYEIEHPVINDKDHEVWDLFGANSWPTTLLIDPEGNAIWGQSGEIKFEDVDRILKLGLPYYKKKKTLDTTPIRFELLADRQQPTPLRFPGKVLADEAGDRLFITDSNHNRIVITSLAGELKTIIGSGEIGSADGGYEQASFDHPQGVALHGQTLYVADTENHLLRKIDLAAKKVSTIAGLGHQARSPWPGLEALGAAADLPDRWVGEPAKTALNSPWAVWVHKDGLYIAMAGPHQIWRMALDESEIGPYAGNGREDIVDGKLVPQRPYALGFSSFAQPSGLVGDGTWLYVADSEGSSIRAVPFDPAGEVRTVVGTADLPFGRLFEFGDIDGPREKVRLQHALGVTYHDKQLYIADTYNNKIKVINAETGETQTLAGDGQPGSSDDPPQFDEPAGISYAAGKLYVADTNNHAIRVIDIASKKVSTLQVAQLAEPKTKKTAAPKKPKFTDAAQVKVKPSSLKPVDGKLTLQVELQLPSGWKINDLAPMSYWVDATAKEGPVQRGALGRTKLEKPAAKFAVSVPVEGEGKDELTVSMNYYYCQDGGEGICKIGSVVFTVPVVVDPKAESTAAPLVHKVD